jgi:hypothetical protein
MSQREALSPAAKRQIYEGKLEGKTLPKLAAEVGCSVACARKWWRRGRDEGLSGLAKKRVGRGSRGYLSQFEARVSELALHYKQSHPGWGARRVLVELQQTPELKDLALPGISRLADFFKKRCPECVNSPCPRPQPIRPARASQVHQIWQLDSQEGIGLADGQIATICNIWDEVGAACLASRAFSVKTVFHWRKLTLTEVQSVLRAAFSEWQTLPDSILTDNELGLAGSPKDIYPAQLTLWLVGLAIAHHFIQPGQPTDQAKVERGHWTLNGFACDPTSLTNLSTLQKSLDRERFLYHHYFPSRARGCAGRPPLIAFPELLQPRRPYQPQTELHLFSLQRVADYLATFNFIRKVNAAGQFSLGRQTYYLGTAYCGQTITAVFDPFAHLWLIRPCQPDQTDPQASDPLIAQLPIKAFSVEAITGLTPEPTHLVQLTLPGF